MTIIVISEPEEKFTEHRKVKADVFGKKFQIIVKYEAFRVYRTHPLCKQEAIKKTRCGRI